jgi:hypothetical protein
MNRIALLRIFFALALCPPAFGQPTIVSITPDHGPVAGGTEVTIKGHGFTECDVPPCANDVIFDTPDATATRIIDDETIIAVTPRHLPGKVRVSFRNAVLTVLFEYTGPASSAFEQVLVPLLIPPVRGAFGSEFHTDLRFAARDKAVQLWGLSTCRGPITCLYLQHPAVARPAEPIWPHDVIYDGAPGRFVFVPSDQFGSLAANLRVYDVTRSELNFGAEIPLVRLDDFRSLPIFGGEGRLVLPGIPTDSRFRNTLRIYSFGNGRVNVRVEGEEENDTVVPLSGAIDMFSPAYGEFTDFPTHGGTVRVSISLFNEGGVVTPSDQTFPIWAMVTVTNNETQMSSTITPQP